MYVDNHYHFQALNRIYQELLIILDSYKNKRN